MPIEMNEFEGGDKPKRKIIQRNIVRILKKNLTSAISAREFENILNVRRQNVNQALRALERKGYVKRGIIKEGSRSVVYASLTKLGETSDMEGVSNDKEPETTTT